MKVLVVLLAVIGSILAAREAKGPNGLAALLAEQGGLVPVGGGTRVVGGQFTPIEQVPYIVTMQRFGAHRCGGANISPRRCLTAAHCTFLIQAAQLSIRAGSSYSQSGGQLIQIASIVNHPQYNPLTLNNDISIMHLQTPFDESHAAITPIAIPVQGAGVPAGIIARVAGWGAMSEGGPAPPNLQSVTKPVVSNAECNASYGGGITEGMLCAGYPQGGRDACQGDSGGPLTTGNNLVGIVSWGEGCARPNRPGVYARVPHYTNWINSNPDIAN